MSRRCDVSNLIMKALGKFIVNFSDHGWQEAWFSPASIANRLWQPNKAVLPCTAGSSAACRASLMRDRSRDRKLKSRDGGNSE
jgi:hypothetical protein